MYYAIWQAQVTQIQSRSLRTVAYGPGIFWKVDQFWNCGSILKVNVDDENELRSQYIKNMYVTLQLQSIKCNKIIKYLISGSRSVSVFTSVYLSVCRFSAGYLKNRSPNLTQKCSKMSPRNPFILGSKHKTSRLRVTKTAGMGLCTLWVMASSSYLLWRDRI